MQRIQLRTVLAEIDLYEQEGRPLAFSLGYYKTNGTKGSKPAVRKGGQSGVGAPKTGASSAFRYKVKEKGTLQLVDCATQLPFALKICLLTHYNGQAIQH